VPYRPQIHPWISSAPTTSHFPADTAQLQPLQGLHKPHSLPSIADWLLVLSSYILLSTCIHRYQTLLISVQPALHYKQNYPVCLIHVFSHDGLITSSNMYIVHNTGLPCYSVFTIQKNHKLYCRLSTLDHIYPDPHQISDLN
jgi:hypothetical protein